MNSVFIAEHHKILQADILWEMGVCIIVDYIVTHPLFGYALIAYLQKVLVLHCLIFDCLLLSI